MLLWPLPIATRYNIRISGQDVGRGTFSQRHLMIVDQESDVAYVPLNYLHNDQGHLEVANRCTYSQSASIASRFSACSRKRAWWDSSTDSRLTIPTTLCVSLAVMLLAHAAQVIWEAQFGDFFNTAQAQFDIFITSSETKWLRQTGTGSPLPDLLAHW